MAYRHRHEDDGTWHCDACGELASDKAHECEECGNQVCVGCAYDCADCGRDLCSHCANAGEYLSPGVVARYRCDDCHAKQQQVKEAA